MLAKLFKPSIPIIDNSSAKCLVYEILKIYFKNIILRFEIT